MFYSREIAALLICWLFYCELYWRVERAVLKTCSRQLIDKRCKSFFQRLFFTPVSGKARLGALYFVNKYTFIALTFFTAFHLALGWNEALQGVIRAVTTAFVIALGAAALVSSASSTERVCTDFNISSPLPVLFLKLLFLLSEILLILTYMYFAWCYIY